jgi:hypothetical protein
MPEAPASAALPDRHAAFKRSVKLAKKLSTPGKGRSPASTPGFATALKALFRLHPCRYQQGPKQGELTGNMQAEVLPAGPNVEFKEAMLQLQLDSHLRWYPEDKVFKLRVHTKEHAALILTMMRQRYPDSDLPLTIEDAGEWNPDCVKEIAVVPTDCVVAKSGIDVGKVILNDGDSLFPLKEHLKELGFTFVKDFNNVAGQDFWVAPAEKVDLAALAALYEKWGWDATLYDGAE